MQNAPAPDVDRLISGGRDRRRRRNTDAVRRCRRDRGRARRRGCVRRHADRLRRPRVEPAQPSEPSESATTAPPLPIDGRRLEPGTVPDARRRRWRPAPRSTPTSPSTDRAGPAGPPAVVERGTWHGGVGCLPPLALAAGSGCTGDEPNTDVGRDLGGPRRAARPAPAEHGRPAAHADRGVRPRRHPPAGADRQRLPGGTRATASRRRREAVTASTTATAPRTSSSTSGSWTWTGPRSWSTMWHQEDASSELLDRIARTRDSITFVTSG